MPATARSQIGVSVRLIATFLSRAWPAPTRIATAYRVDSAAYSVFCVTRTRLATTRPAPEWAASGMSRTAGRTRNHFARRVRFYESS